jgi:protein TonB
MKKLFIHSAMAFAIICFIAACGGNKNKETSTVDSMTTMPTETAAVVQPDPTTGIAAAVIVPPAIDEAVKKANSMTKKEYHHRKVKKIKKNDGSDGEVIETITFLELVPDVEAPAGDIAPATPADQRPKDSAGYHYKPDKMPSFKGGEKALDAYLEKNLVYPAQAEDNGIQGTVLLRFSVDETGKIYTPKVISKPLGFGLEEEAISIVEKMPAWNPGMVQDKAVKSKFTLPIKFELQN